MSKVIVPISSVTFFVPEAPSKLVREKEFEYNVSNLPEVTLSLHNALLLCKVLNVKVEEHAPSGTLSSEECCEGYNKLRDFTPQHVQPYVAQAIQCKLQELFLLAYHSKQKVVFV